MDFSFLEKNKIIPVVVLDRAEKTVPVLEALKRGGINIAEITFRTACAEEAVKIAVEKFPDTCVGAGTVINEKQCARALELGVKFIVSPGFDEGVSRLCKEADVPYIPGAVTPTEIIRAKAEGWNIIKFFPAEAFGGVKTIKAISAAFPDLKFVPTGGIDAENVKSYLSLKFVAAVGGSWMMRGSLDEIALASKAALEAVKEF